MNNSNDVMTPAEVAQVFRVDTKTVRRWVEAGKLPYFKTLGGHRRFYRKDIEKFLNESRTNNGA